MEKETWVMIDEDATSPGGRRRKVCREEEKIDGKTRKYAWLYMQVGARKEVRCRKKA